VAATLAALTQAGPSGAGLGGIGLGLLTLCRPSFLPAAALATVAAALASPGNRRSRLIRASLLGAATAATLAPWALRNARDLGESVWTTTHGGYTLALANNPIYYAEVLDGPPGAVWGGAGQARWWAQVARTTAGMSESDADRTLRRSPARPWPASAGSGAWHRRPPSIRVRCGPRPLCGPPRCGWPWPRASPAGSPGPGRA